jgi:hypothetical protein
MNSIAKHWKGPKRTVQIQFDHDIRSEHGVLYLNVIIMHFEKLNYSRNDFIWQKICLYIFSPVFYYSIISLMKQFELLIYFIHK